MRETANDRIARRAKELHDQRMAASREAGAEAARKWLASGPVRTGARFRPSPADRRALKAA